MVDNLTFVSAYYKVYEDSDNETYIEHFIKIAEKGVKIVLFLDPLYTSIAHKFKAYPNIKVIKDIDFEDLPVACRFAPDCKLPAYRNEKKDTYKYITLMNSKLDFIKMAIPYVTTPNIAWIDFGIVKIIKKLDVAWAKITNIIIPGDKILMPGCTQKSVVSFDNVHWRFCGGLFFGTKENMLKFQKLSSAKLKSIQETNNTLTWEVNIWAMIEKDSDTELFQWYSADHNDRIFNFPLPKKIIATIMIKNEERIIKRCIDRAITIADAICISDTGSTDSTLDILKEYLPTLSIPTKVVNHTWKNFGFNRTLSFQASADFCKELEWNPEFTYGLLLDGDMNFVMTDKFQKTDLTANGYRIIQRNSHLEYYNTRFVKLGYPWRCVGVTHEYWDGSDCEPLNTVYIEDIGDGGCKDDKFIRDERLLRQGLEEEPNNERYMFYLAQTLKDLKKLPESIEMYKRRINAGGWYEEVWYSMYVISKLYYELGNYTEMEYWGMKAYDFNKNRSENLYFLTRIFRDLSQHHKAWHYMKLGSSIKKPNDLLFLELDVYSHLFAYERTILDYYVHHYTNDEALRHLIEYYNGHGGHCYSNLQHYVNPIKTVDMKLLPFKQIGDYVATSTSMVKQSNGYLFNIRYVNYRIQRDGSYLMMLNGELSRNNPVMTRNFMLQLDSNFVATGPLEEMFPAFPSKHDVHIKGLEDLRIYQDGNEIKWIGTSMEFSYNAKIRQIVGTYHINNNKLTGGTSLRPPFKENDCEKNWIPLGNNEYIYSWYPYRIGKAEGENFSISETQDTPKFFEHVRGSTNLAHYYGSLYCIVHVVQYVQPRKYYHMVVRINKGSRKIEAYTNPFYFKTNSIEYTLGMDIVDGGFIKTVVSQYDMNPMLVTIDMATLKFYNI
jgi:hypothetical protein